MSSSQVTFSSGDLPSIIQFLYIKKSSVNFSFIRIPSLLLEGVCNFLAFTLAKNKKFRKIFFPDLLLSRICAIFPSSNKLSQRLGECISHWENKFWERGSYKFGWAVHLDRRRNRIDTLLCGSVYLVRVPKLDGSQFCLCKKQSKY